MAIKSNKTATTAATTPTNGLILVPYTYHTVTGPVTIMVPPYWKSVLKSKDIDEYYNNNKYDGHVASVPNYGDDELSEEEAFFQKVLDKACYDGNISALEECELYEQTRDWVREVIKKPEWLDIVESVCLGGMSQTEYAEAKGIAVSSVSQKLARAVKKLKKARTTGRGCPLDW